MSKTAANPVGTENEPPAVLDTRRQWLTEAEVERIIRAADNDRDRLMILMAYRHGLRVSELINIQWGQLDLAGGRFNVVRLKGGENSAHPLSGREVRGLRKLRQALPVGSRFVFMTSRGGPMTRNGFFKLLEKAARKAGLDDVHPHLLRHGCGFRLVNDHRMDSISLASYLGHANVQNTKRYAQMSSTRFDGLWRD
jgi:integrase